MTTPQHPAPPQHAPQQAPQPPAGAPAYAHQAPHSHHAPQAPGPQAGYWPGQAPGGGYVSPIPIRRATLADALLSEWTKIRSVRSTVWTLGVMVLLVVGIGLLVAVGFDSTGNEMHEGSPLFVGFFGLLLGIICVITLGVLTISSEYGTGLIRTTLTACPNRGRVLAAKAVVFFLLTFTIMLLCTVLVSMAGWTLLEDQSSFDPSAEAWLRATVGVSLYTATLGLVALAVGTLLRHSAGAITVMLGVVLLPLVLAMFMATDALSDIRQAFFEYSIPNQLAAFYGTSADPVSGPSGWTPLWIMIGVAAGALGGAYASLVKRDA
ncbi:ABC transporter permease subunit [Streptomyces sp. SCA3-4]|uniref:ABC transporter permease subunit n=1 Tax=Streptomyces sichuanensis TaxID=2871810 RepID=UPI001CE2EF81|nr:ABC transporter permease subunit [Streptomyces sichuanensis]MCA6096654.1 ABC transporter permease subunit [Streptomyces sichuanensis]